MADLAALSAELAAVQESLQRAQKDRIEAERVLEAEKARVHQLQADSEGDRARLAALGSQLDAATDTLKSVLVKGCTAFLLEKQPNISVYTLHLSYCCRGCGALPWSPAVTVREKRRVEISCRVDVDGFPGCLDCGRREVSLQLQLATEVEAGKFTASAGPECVLIRMPFFYPGSIKSCHTGGSFMASEELTSLSTLTHGVHCKFCASALVQAGQFSRGALALPSEYWIELSDEWLCHPEAGQSLPTVDLAASPHRVLVGETHILIDWSDFSTADGVCTVLMTPAEANRMGVDEAGDDSIPHIVRCARCECPVGTALYQPAGGTVEGSIRIHKDRIALLSASRENVFSKYTICTRLFTELVDRASAHSQYRFLLHACDEVRGDVIGDDGCVTECAGLAGTGLRGRLILLNWNSAVAQCPGGVPDHSHTIISEVSALKLAFDAWDGEPSPSKLSEVEEWHLKSEAYPVILLAEEIEEVGIHWRVDLFGCISAVSVAQIISQLRVSHGLLHASTNSANGMSIGYLQAISC